jgi:hypothetical protein
MIARFRVLLPFAIHLKRGDDFAPQAIASSGEEFTIYPPYSCSHKAPSVDSALIIPFADIHEQLAPSESVPDLSVGIDGKPSIRADALQIDLRRPNFDRLDDPKRNPIDDDPPATQFVEVANTFLARIRSALQASVVKSISLDRCPWAIEYLTDAAETLPTEDGKFRRRASSCGSRQITAINHGVWNDVAQMAPTFSSPVWETLLLDAALLLPEVGPAVVLAATALENLANDCLDALSTGSGMPAPLWSWINHRGDHRSEPATEEQFDVLLKLFSGKSLKDKPDLWNGFMNLKNARNNFVHKGRASIGKSGPTLTPGDALSLIVKATQIVTWIEQLLPPEKRRQKSGAKILTQVSQQI